MTAKFKHDCEKCKFLGHFLGFDVYTCGSSLIARDGDEQSSYASTDIMMFKRMIRENVMVGRSNGPPMTYRRYMLEGGYHSAWVLALACQE